ncbi:hypothetical protein ACFE04_008968 [Oxalis oulophora]
MEQSNLFIPNSRQPPRPSRQPPPPSRQPPPTTAVNQSNGQKGQLCDVCGATNRKDELVSCSKCSVTRHINCMRQNIPENWVCGNCDRKKDFLTSPNRDSLDAASQEHMKKIGKSLKIKTVSVEEAKKLNSGSEIPEKVSKAPGAGSSGVKHRGPSYMPSIGSKLTNQDSVPRTQVYVRNKAVIPKNPEITQRKPKVPEEQKGKRLSSSILVDNVHNEQPIDAGKPCKKVKPSVTITEKISSASPKDVAPPRELTSGQNVHLATTKNTDAAKKKLLLNPKKREHYFPSCPSTSVAWRGAFQIRDSVSGRLGEPYRYFKAQPPWRIQKKAYELLESMPLMLQVKLIPHGRLWPKMFSPRLLPDLGDIALYLFPSDSHCAYKSEENLASLFELMDSQKSAMLTCIDGVDLIIFTSKQLHIDAQYLMKHIKAEHFLCGVFYHRKKIESVKKKQVEIPYPFGSAPDCHQTSMDDSRVIDEEIDIVGGKETVGQVEAARVDSIPIQWAPTPTGFVKLNVAGWFNEYQGFSTAAVVVRDDSALWLFGYSLKVNHHGRLTAMMDALHYGLKSLWDSGRRKVLVQSSLKEAVELLEREQAPVAGNPTLALISQKCRKLIQADWVCQVSLVNEQANSCAKWLATHPHGGKDRVHLKPPEDMRHLYESDRAQEQTASRVP